MLIHERKPDLERVKEVKVKIPVGMHIKLHSMKVLTGKQISDAVTEALTVYFEATSPRPGLMAAAHELAEAGAFPSLPAHDAPSPPHT